jgi:hypothetical protein
MARPNGKKATFTITGTGEADVVTEVFGSVHSKRGATYYVHSTQAGTAKVYYVDPSGTARELDLKIMTADAFHVFDFDFPVPESKLTFTATVGSGTLTVETFSY